MKVILLLVFFCFTFQIDSQIISGSLVGEDSSMIFNDLTYVITADIKTTCEYPGYFELESLNPIDTLVIVPPPVYIRVKIYNFPEDIDTINLDSIPIFEDNLDAIPIINFRTKRAAKKFFRKFEQQKLVEEKQLIEKIENSNFYWNNRLIPLKVRRVGESLEVLIDLNK